jgi:death-on-curing protein
MEHDGYAPAPLLNPANLESALARPQNAAGYAGADLIRQAATLTIGIAQAQAFLDGNKRVAFDALHVFLELNGCQYVGDPIDLAQWLLTVAERRADDRVSIAAAVDEFDAWLRQRITTVSTRTRE